MLPESISTQIQFLGEELASEILKESKLIEAPEGTEILHEGQYVKIIPLVLNGLVRVFVTHEDKELLLYYIEPKESCIMSFTAGMDNTPSRINAVCIEPSIILAMPVHKVNEWSARYPPLIRLLYSQFNIRYLDLIETINQVIFRKLDKRILTYLTKMSSMQNKTVIETTHQKLANELGTAREVVSRVLKKLEEEGKVKQDQHQIHLLH